MIASLSMAVQVFLVGLLFLQLVLSEDCIRDENQPTCVCRTSRGIIDLTPLSKNASAMFENIVDPQDRIYSYNPCNAYTDGGCTNAFICERDPDSPQKHAIADGGEKIFGKPNGAFFINYTSSFELIRMIEVSLFCDQGQSSGQFVALGDTTGTGTYYFELHSCYACPGGCKSTRNLAGFAGLILIALVILTVLIYFIVGAVIRKVHYHATGTDIIPNKDFWVSLPLLLKWWDESLDYPPRIKQCNVCLQFL